MRRTSKRLRWSALAGLAALMVSAAVAVAAVETKEEYKALVEPICKKNKQESDRLLKGVKNLVKKDKLKQAGERFAKAANALERTQKELAAVEQPPAYTAKLTKWLSEIKAEVSLMRKISAKFKAGNKSKATSLAVTLQNNATKANNGVIIFQFNYCKIDPSKYT
jgi:hypothetical protein